MMQREKMEIGTSAFSEGDVSVIPSSLIWVVQWKGWLQSEQLFYLLRLAFHGSMEFKTTHKTICLPVINRSIVINLEVLLLVGTTSY